PRARMKDAARPQKVASHPRELALVTPPKGARGVTKTTVPLGPAGRKAGELIAMLAQVPWLGDQFGAGEQRILSHRRKERAVGPEGAIVAAKRGGEVETEPVDLEFPHPIAQRIEHQLQHARVGNIERVTASRDVLVEARVFRQAVV